jgi:ankyrin repeat protein
MFCLPEVAAMGHSDMVIYILSLGVDPDQLDASGWTPLHRAVRCSHLDVVQTLIARGAKVDFSVYGETPLATAVWMCNPQIARVLLESGADANRRGRLGRTPVHQVGLARRIQFPHSNSVRLVFQALLDHGGDPTLRDDENKSPLYLAVASDNEQAVQLL